MVIPKAQLYWWILKKDNFNGFTLAELLITLAILGVIATFTIPKILVSQQNQAKNSMAKEVAAMVLGAHQKMQSEGTLRTDTSFMNMTPYFNYVAIDTTSTIDLHYGGGTRSCSVYSCLKLHNGSTVLFDWPSFGGSATTNAIWFAWDPDGTSDGTTNGPGKSVVFYLYYNGALKTVSSIPTGTQNSWGSSTPIPNADPSWFSW